MGKVRGLILWPNHQTKQCLGAFIIRVENSRPHSTELATLSCDFPGWLDTLSPQKRQIAERLAVGDATSEVAQACRMKFPKDGSQIRRELVDSWWEYYREQEGCTQETGAATG